MTRYDLFDSSGSYIGELRERSDDYYDPPTAEEIEKREREAREYKWWGTSGQWRAGFALLCAVLALIYVLLAYDVFKAGILAPFSLVVVCAIGAGVGQLVGLVVYRIALPAHNRKKSDEQQ